MTEETPSTLLYAVNYGIVMDLLGFSQAKLAGLKDRWNDLIFRTDAVLNDLPLLQGILKVTEEQVYASSQKVKLAFDQINFDDLSLISIRDDAYPQLLKAISRPPLILFARGNTDLLKTPCVSVVGSRQASPEAIRRAQKVSVILTSAGYTVVSGLAKGIDTAAHQATLKADGRTIGVIGTPITKSYPPENFQLQERLATEQLLISQFPFNQPVSKFNFPTRNFTMAGMSIATIIVEAGETSGALHQATACLNEGRLLFIMKSILSNKSLSWPNRYIDRGAIILDSPETLLESLTPRLELRNGFAALPQLQQLSVFQNVVND